jgi:ABC-type multidrug transport system ATPase subunit
VVEAQALVKRYGKTVAVDGVSFAVRPGEVFGFIGPDGAGKTTLFRILTTLVAADSGEARVLGLDVVRDLWAIRSRVGYMPGRFSLYPDLSVEENLRFFASVFGTTLEAGYDQIAPIYRPLEPFGRRRAAALSGGMKQKLALSCALVHRPDLLLLDEPTTGVDAVSRHEFWTLLDGLKASGLAIIVSTPYMDEASRCDRVALVQRGRILRLDTPAAIGNGYRYPLVAVRARSADRVRLLRVLRELPHPISVFPFGAEVHYTDARVEMSAEEVAADVAAHLAANSISGVRVVPVRAGIEDSFMALMARPGEEVVA